MNTGSFVTLNGKRWRESISDLKKALAEANDMGVTKKGTVLSWLAGNFNNDYDFAKNLDSDTKALQAGKLTNAIKGMSADVDNCCSGRGHLGYY